MFGISPDAVPNANTTFQLTEEQVAECEKSLGYKLPAVYVDLCKALEVGSVSLNKDCSAAIGTTWAKTHVQMEDVYTRTHTHTHTDTHTREHKHTHAHTHTQTDRHTHTNAPRSARDFLLTDWVFDVAWLASKPPSPPPLLWSSLSSRE